MTHTVPVLALRGVTFAHAGREPVLVRADHAFDSGGFSLVRGPSGAGKSTLLRLLCRLDEPRAGSVLYDGEPLERHAPAALRRQVAYVHQTPVTVPGTVRDNLLFPFGFQANQDLRTPDDTELRERLGAFLLSDVSLDHEASACSVGQRQRLCLVRTLLLSPRVLLLDEPVSGLDPESREVVERTVEDLARDKGVSVIMVSHHDYAPGVPHTVCTVRDGKIVSENGSETTEQGAAS